MESVSGIGALTSRRVLLRPLLPSDGEWVYALMCGPSGARWRYRGRTPSHDAVAADLWRGVFAQFVVLDRATGGRCGLVGLYNVAPEAGRAYAFALAEPDRATSVTEAFGLLCAWGFDQHGFQRIFVESAEFNLEHFASLGRAAVVEGRLRNHDLWQGRYWDLFVLSITPESFAEHFGSLLERRRLPEPAPGTSAEQLADTVDELWPLDSLGLVEVLDALESHLGAAVDAEVVLDIRAESPQRWVAEALDRARPVASPS